MGLPFRKHLEWLCIEEMDTKSIQNFYDNIQLPVPTLKDIEEASARIVNLILPPSVKKNIKKGIYKAEDNFAWEKAGYGELHQWRCSKGKDDTWSQVGKILNHPLMRTSLDVCNIIGMEEDKITVLSSQVYKVQITEDAIRLYKKFFGNFENFGRQDWRDYLSRLSEDHYVYTRIFAALTRPREEALVLCGLPTENQFSDFLKNVLAVANYKFNHYSRQNSKEGDSEARKWAKIGFESGEKFDKFGAADASDFAKLVQTEFEYVTPNFETLDGALASDIRPQIGSTDSNKTS